MQSDSKKIIGKLKNPGFELSDGVQDEIPVSWIYSAWIFETAQLTWDKKVAGTGTAWFDDANLEKISS